MGVTKLGVWPAMLLMCTTRLGLTGDTLPDLLPSGGLSQRDMAN